MTGNAFPQLADALTTWLPASCEGLFESMLGQTSAPSPAFILVAFVILGIVLLVSALVAWRLIFSEGNTQRDFRSEFDKDEAERQANKPNSLNEATKLSRAQASAETVESEPESEAILDRNLQPRTGATDLELGGTVRSSDTIENSEACSSGTQHAIDDETASTKPTGNVQDKPNENRSESDDLEQPASELELNTDPASRQTVDTMGDKSVNSDDSDDSDEA